MNELFTQTYYGNTLQEWAISAAVIILSFVVGKIIYWMFSKLARRLSAKTKTQLDDILIDLAEEPFVVTFILSGVWFGIILLNMPESTDVFIGRVFQFMIVMMAAWLIVRLLDAIFENVLVPLTDKTEGDLDDQLLPIVRKGTRIAVWTMALIIGLNNAGYDVAALIAGLGIGGLALAMAAKDTVSNVFGGFTIFTDKPFSLNDRVKVAGYDGTIKEIGVRSTRLITLEGRTVTIPNSKFADSPVENVSWEPSRKVSLVLGLTYDTQPEAMQNAINILHDIAASQESLEEKRIIFFSGFADSAMEITFIYYISSGSDIAGIQNNINLAILTRFNEARLGFAFPSQTLYHVQTPEKNQQSDQRTDAAAV